MNDIMTRDERRLQRLCAHMVVLVGDTIIQGFTYKEGIAMFKTLAETLVHIDETDGQLDDVMDATLMSQRLREHLKDQS